MRDHKIVTKEQIKSALQKIKLGIDCGESIQMARKKACGHDQSPLCQKVMHTEEYVEMLNKYLEKIGLWNRFDLIGNDIKPRLKNVSKN